MILLALRRSWPVLALARTALQEPARYFFASAAALMVDLGTFSVAIRLLGLGWSVSACLGFLFGALVAYWASVRWVFNERSERDRPERELTLFILVGACGLLVTQAALWLCIERLTMPAEISRLLAAGLTFTFNYLVRAMLLFRLRTPVLLSK